MVTGKRVALLVNGPSLTTHWREPMALDFDLIVAMNTAGWVFPHDYAVVTDPQLVREVVDNGKMRPMLGMVCYEAHAQRLSQCGIRWVEMIGIPKSKPYTFPKAIVFALKQAGPAGTVELFGVDWTDSKTDVAGVSGDHNPKRWQQEAEVVRRVWDSRIVAVHGAITPARLDYFKGKRNDWPA